MLLPQEGSLSIHTSLPATGDGSSPVMAAVRLLAEIRSRLVFQGLEPGGIPLETRLVVPRLDQWHISVVSQSVSGDGPASGGQLLL